MRKLHYDEHNDGLPSCGVYRNQKRETTTDLDAVNCRSCIRWMAYVLHDTSLFDRIYA